MVTVSNRTWKCQRENLLCRAFDVNDNAACLRWERAYRWKQLVIIHVSRSGHIGIRLTAHYDTARLNRKHALGHIHGTCYLAYASAAYNATLGEDEPLCISMTHREAKASSERADERRSLFKGAGAELIKISNSLWRKLQRALTWWWEKRSVWFKC